jgi:Zn-dependent peptidase ImmA (M78 family)/DNA-binding XRE family transcriptional regulator
MAERADITPDVLAWARKTARMSTADAAKKAGVKEEKYIEWEAGESQPTIHQAQSVAKAFRRPFVIFFLSEPPNDFMPLQDFRKANAIPLSTSSMFIMREIQGRQQWIGEELEEEGEDPLPFIGRFSQEDGPAAVAKDILKVLDIDPLAYETDKPLNEWINKAEAAGIFVSRASYIHTRMKISPDELQGFAIADKYAPFVFINSADWKSAQLFTLVHELAHIWIAISGISNGVELLLNESAADLQAVEYFCNQVAGKALIPDQLVAKDNDIPWHNPAEVYQTALSLGVSSFAFIIRAKNNGAIDHNTYADLKAYSTKMYKQFLRKKEREKATQKAKKGGPSPYLMTLQRNGQMFTEFVMMAMKGGRIAPTYASQLLNVKFGNFKKLEEKMYS